MDSKAWLQRQKQDVYARQAREKGYLNRASFKLLQIQERDRLIKAGMTVMDLGAAPGGWLQVLAELMHPEHRVTRQSSQSSSTGRPGNKTASKIVALDRLPLQLTLPEVHFVQGDFTQQQDLNRLLDCMQCQQIHQFDLVLSDMAPNTSGIRMVDQCESMYLAELARDFCLLHLRAGGNFLVKVFEGQGLTAYRKDLQQHFAKVVLRKPKASRPESRERYLLACSKHSVN